MIVYLKRAADQRHPDATYALALCYRDGTGVSKDRLKAIELLELAIELGFSDAQDTLDAMNHLT